MAKWAVYDEEEDLMDDTFSVIDVDETDFDWFQNECRKTAIYPKQQGLVYTALGLASEAGEYAGKIKKGIRDGDFDDQAAAAELGDVLWYVATSAHELGYTLDEIAHGVIKKLRDRKERDALKGSGDSR